MEEPAVLPFDWLGEEDEHRPASKVNEAEEDGEEGQASSLSPWRSVFSSSSVSASDSALLELELP